jgi:DNA repair protein RadC
VNGHRLRLLQKFVNNPSSFEPVDILELVLFVTNSRRNTRDVARAILNRYKQICSIGSAEIQELTQIDGLGEFSAIFLKALFKLCDMIANEKVEHKPLSIEYLIDYIRLLTQNKSYEILFVAMVDIRNRVTSVEEVARGESTCVHINIKLLVKLILNKEPNGIIILHNHPSGDVTPSSNDIQNTKHLKRILAMFDIDIHDSIIVGNDKYFSLSAAGLI